MSATDTKFDEWFESIRPRPAEPGHMGNMARGEWGQQKARAEKIWMAAIASIERPPITGELETVAWTRPNTAPLERERYISDARLRLNPDLYEETHTVALVRLSDTLAHRDAIREALELVARDAIACIQSAFYAGQDKNDSGTLLKANINELSVRLDAALLASPGTGEGQ